MIGSITQQMPNALPGANYGDFTRTPVVNPPDLGDVFVIPDPGRLFAIADPGRLFIIPDGD